MPAYVDGMPFSDVDRAGTIGAVPVIICAYQPIVLVSLTHPKVTTLQPASSTSPPRTPSKFPAIVDTGFTGALFLQEQHLTAASGSQLTMINLPPAVGATMQGVTGNTTTHPCRQVRVWLHPYPATSPHSPLDLGVVDATIYLTPPGSAQPLGPQLPLLGALSFTPRKLRVTIDYDPLKVRIEN